MRRVLVFGGSFDPPHRGHSRLLQAGIRALRPSRTIVVPSKLSPFKKSHAASVPHRLRMLSLMLEEKAARGQRPAIDRFELERQGRTYTYQLLRRLRSRFPSEQLWFLCGSDCFAALGGWKRQAELRKGFRWAVGRRPGAAAFGRPDLLLPGVFPDISSSELRARLLLGEDCSAQIPAPVLRYIRRNGLYGAGIREALRRELKPERYRHSLAVAGLAARLARAHGENIESAARAGLLHDCGRSLDPAQMRRYALRRRLPIPAKSKTLRHAPLLAHAYISADMARRRFGVSDAAVLGAIAHHTLGKPGLSRLERLLYVADAASPDRNFPEAAPLRALAMRDLDSAFKRAARMKLRHARSMGHWEHPMGAALLRSIP